MTLTEPVVIAEFPKNSRESVRVALDEFKGQTLISIRVFYKDSADEWRPGRSGLSMAVHHLPHLAEALAAAEAKARELRLVAGDGR